MDSQQISVVIKEIARGKNAARSLCREDSRSLFAAMLGNRIPPLQLGAILIAMRIKGESLDELAGFLEACEASYPHLHAPPGRMPVIIPAYNGARRLPNLTPLLALLIARQGVPVLVHGVPADPGRVTTLEIFSDLGIAPAASLAEAEGRLAEGRLAVIAIDTLAPDLARVLALRRDIGLRSSAHTLVKMLQPFRSRALRLVSVTHPEYLERMRGFFTTHAADALLLRGAEGEAVAHPRREPAVEWLDGRSAATWQGPADLEPLLPEDKTTPVTAAWIRKALAGEVAVPAAINHQVACILRASAIIENPQHP